MLFSGGSNAFRRRLIKPFALVLALAALLLFGPARLSALASPPLQVPSCVLAPATPNPSNSVCMGQIAVNVDGPSTLNSFSVSWISTAPQTGQVQLLGGGLYDDVRGAGFSGITHYVPVNNLQPGLSYQFDIVSGGVTYRNYNQHWTIKLGPALSLPAPDNIIGRVRNAEDGDASEALVYVTIAHPGSSPSSLLSEVMTSDDAGFFHLSLSDARTADGTARYSYDPNADALYINVVGPDGTASWQGATGDPRPGKPSIILTMSSTGGSAATATPLPEPPTSTPISPTAAPSPTLPPATATSAAATAVAATSIAEGTETAAPPAPPSATVPSGTAAITIAPAEKTQVAQAGRTGTTGPGSQITRLAPTPANGPASSGGSTSSLFLPALAALAFLGALALGLAAIFVWKR